MASERRCVLLNTIDNEAALKATLGQPLDVQSKLECGQTLSRLAMEAMAPKTVQVLNSRGTGLGRGSGFFVGKDGDQVVTNAHVVADHEQVLVRTLSGEVFSTRVLDVDDINDLAVLQVEGIKKDPGRAATLGDDSKLKIGDPLLAVGHPGGFVEPVVSDGSYIEHKPWWMHYQSGNGLAIVRSAAEFSRLNPTYAADATANVTAPKLGMDTPIWHGSSGGPVVDEFHKVMGVSSAIDDENPYKTMAVPVSKVRELLGRSENKFNFTYKGQSEFDRAPVLVGVTDGVTLAAAVALRKYAAPVLGVANGLDVPSNLKMALRDDTYKSRWYYAERAGESAAGTVGGVLSLIPRTRTVGFALVGAKLVADTVRNYIPDSSVLTGVSRTDGEPRVPLLWEGKVF